MSHGARLTDDPTRRTRVATATLAVGFLGLAAAALLAHRAPATGYELSVYRATPAGFWAGVGLAGLTGLAVAWTPDVPTGLRRLGAAAAAGAVLAVAALPVLRGYYHVGAGDSLTHLGWMREMAAGVLEPAAFLYPGVHTTSLFLGAATGVGDTLATEYAVLAFVAVYLLFVPLCVREIVGRRGDATLGLVAGTLGALFVLPVNNVSVHLMPHPTTQAILFAPLLLFLAFRYLAGSPDRAGLDGPVTPWGLLLGLGSIGVVLVHPQMALSVLVLFAAVSALQLFYRRARPDHPIASHRPLYVQTLFLALAFSVWAVRYERVQAAVVAVVAGVVGAGGTPANEIAQRGASLAVLGGSLGELFAKLFLASLVFACLAGALALASLAGRLDPGRPHRNALVKYLSASLVPLGAVFVLLFVSSVTTQHFRYAGFLMVPVTLLGAVALVVAARNLPGWVPGRAVAGTAAVVVAALLVVSTATLFPSPYIYQPNGQVSQQQFEGFETAFDHRDPSVAYAGIRSGPNRQMHAHFGTTRSAEMAIPGRRTAVPTAVFGHNLTDYYDRARYLPVTERDIEREVALYRGFRYSRDGFTSLSTTPGVSRVQANDEFRLYLVRDRGA